MTEYDEQMTESAASSRESSPAEQPVASTSYCSEAEVENLEPNGPLCSYGTRLAYTYFPAPTPDAETLNKRSESCHFFTVDAALVYLSFYQDWGPLNVAMFYRFSLHLHSLLEDKALTGKRIVLYSSDEADKKANAALLISLYAVVVLRWTAAEALHPIACLETKPFRDAGYARADFHLSIQDCLFGIKKAIDLRLLKLDEFDVREYEMYEKVENGDWNFITPQFLAFASPVESGYSSALASTSNGPPASPQANTRLPKSFRNVIDQFEKKNVKMVIRLNKKLYNSKHFTDLGMQHLEMFFEDGTNPTMEQCREFIDVSDHIIRNGGVVAVHCKAGLGRTGTLIGAFMIYKWGFTANEAIAFQRFMRPGCVVGPQQHYLYTNQYEWVKWAAVDAATGVTRSLPPTITGTSSIQRPDTPPSETELQASQPVHKQSEAVPGQPRKTPGAKRHGVAMPETNDEADPPDEFMLVKDDEEDKVEADEMQIDSATAIAMDLVDPPPNKPSSTSERENTPLAEAAEESLGVGASRNASSGRATTRSASGARSKGKAPLSSSDNHNRSASVQHTQRSPGGSVPRSKAIKDLGNLFNQSDEPATPSQGPERYNLRAGVRSSSGGHLSSMAAPASPTEVKASSSIARPPSTTENPSPTRLPQRVNTKRRTKTQQQPQQPDAFLVASSTLPSLGVDAGYRGKTRSTTRRRRSSMGATDL